MKYFYIIEPVDRCTGPVDHDRVVVHGSMVDHGWRRLKGSPEREPGAAPVSRSSPAVGEKEEEALRVPTVGVGGRCGAVPEGGQRRGCDGVGDLLSTTRGSGRGEMRVGVALDAVESG
jgi:hypothetical protein